MILIISFSTGVSHACYRYFTTLSGTQWIIEFLYAGLMIFASSYDKKKVTQDILVILFLPVPIVIIGVQFIQILLPVFILIFLYRVFEKAKLDRKNYYLLLMLIPLVYTAFTHRDSLYTINCPAGCNSCMSMIRKGLESYREDKGRYPEKLEELEPDYIDFIPTCEPKILKYDDPQRKRINELGKYKPVPYFYEADPKGTSYILKCQSRNHEP